MRLTASRLKSPYTLSLVFNLSDELKYYGFQLVLHAKRRLNGIITIDRVSMFFLLYGFLWKKAK